MSVFSNRLSVSPERPVNQNTISVLRLIDGLFSDAKVPYMLVGATARDLLLYHVFGHRVTRATNDLDFAILVASWSQFAILKKKLTDITGMKDDKRQAQRLYYRPPGANFETIIDIIPFGDLETSDRTIAWPPDADVVMNVVAFADVLESSIVVDVHPDLSIPITSLPGLMVLKLFAWLDRGFDRDVQDIRRLLETYTDVGNEARLYEEEAEELSRVGFDATLAGAFLLGKDVRRITDEAVRQKLALLFSETKFAELVQRTARTISVIDDHTESAEKLLKALFTGMGVAEQL